MKKSMFLFGALFAAGLSFTACSSDNDVAENNGPRLDGSNDAYITLNLNTPSVSGMTRAASDTYEAVDGDATEYAVNNGIIVFFKNSSDNQLTATIASAYTLDDLTYSAKPSSGEVTTQWTATLDITEAGLSETYKYALVILNNQGYFTVDGTNLKINGTAFSGDYQTLMRTRIPSNKMNNGTAINTYCQTTVGSNGILMTNAPLSLTTGSTSPTGVRYLSPILDSNIKGTKAEAQANPVNIYVERATAKVSVAKGSVTEMTNGTLSDGTTKISISALYWIPDNVAPTFNCVREVNQSDLNIVKTSGTVYRYTGPTVAYDSSPSLYRTTWAVDQLGYTSKLALGDLTSIKGTLPSKAGMLASGAVAYVPENTMDYNMMYQYNTTRAVIMAVMGDGSTDYYSFEPLGANKVYEKTAMETALDTYVKGLSAYTSVSWAGTVSFTLSNNSNGTATLVAASTNSGDDTNISTLNTTLASLVIHYFKNGECYYKLQIKHYHPGSTAATEVKDPVLTNGPEYNNVYAETSSGTQKADYLGLYGVVRNTWYEVTVTGIKNVGTSTVPDIPDNPDDEVNSYISAKINVMQWAKRTYNADL